MFYFVYYHICVCHDIVSIKITYLLTYVGLQSS